MEDLITARRLRWLGHVAQMGEERIPKKLLFDWLPERRPAHAWDQHEMERQTEEGFEEVWKFGIVEKRWYAFLRRGLRDHSEQVWSTVSLALPTLYYIRD